MIESRATRQFWRLFAGLPVDVQRDAKRAFRQFQLDPAHPGLQFKKIEGREKVYSIRIGLGYRALAAVEKAKAVWFWIGSHAEYDRLL